MTLPHALALLKQTSPLRITVSGDLGAGKSTFAKHLAEDLGIPRIYIGQLMREEAARRGLTMDAFGELLTKDDSVDRAMDEMQKQKSQEIERGIFEGRTSWHFVENTTVKVFLSVNPQLAAERIWGDNENRLRDTYTSPQEVLEANERRKQVERQRYTSYYGIDVYDANNFDVIFDTSQYDIEGVYERTVIKIAQFLTK